MTRWLTLLFAGLLISGCASMVLSGYGEGGDPPAAEDAAIAARVNRALVQEAAVPAVDVQVTVADGVVTLSGQVPDRKAATRALAVTREVAGVRRVISHLRWD